MRIRDRKGEVIGLIETSDIRISRAVNELERLSISLYNSDPFSSSIKEEYIIETESENYIVKAIDMQKTITRFEAVQDVDGIKGKGFADGVDLVAVDVVSAIRYVLTQTGWTVEEKGTVTTKKRTLRTEKTKNAYEVLERIMELWKVELRFNTKLSKVYISDKFGEDTGVYLSDELNVRANSIQIDTSDLKTKIIPIGKDGLTIESINGGKNYLENYLYTDKVLELVWEDNRYTVVENLLNDAKKKLEELSKPKLSYELDILDLAAMDSSYDFLSFGLGDVLTIISSELGFRDEQRIVSMEIYPKQPERNVVKLANKRQSFADLQQEQEEVSDRLDNITTDTGIDGSKVDEITKDQIKDFDKIVGGVIEASTVIADLIEANKGIFGEIEAGKITVGEIIANLGKFEEIQAGLIQADKVITEKLEASIGKIDNLESEFAEIGTLINGNLSSENIQAGGITGDNLNMSTIFVDDANIVSVNADKINAGSVNTSLVNLTSEDGSMSLQGATQQFKDKDNNVRLQLGKDSKGDFNFILKGVDGKSTIIDHTGIKKEAVADDLIVGDMVAPDAVGEKQIDYNSFATGFNKDTNTTSLKATKIKLDNKNQSLEVAFNSMDKTVADNKNTLVTHTTELNVQKGKINTLIQDTTIVKDGQTVKLKDEYNKTVNTVNTMNQTIGKHETTINEATGEIESVKIQGNEIKKDLQSTKETIKNVESTANSASSKVLEVEKTVGGMSTKVSNIEKQNENQETRLKSAEQKITDSAIINTVKTTIDQAKNDAINSANSSTDGKLNNYVTSSKFTEFKQSSEDFQMKTEKRGTANLLKSANAKKAYHSGDWELRKWNTNLSPKIDYLSYNEAWSYPDPNINTFQLSIHDGWGMWGGDVGIIQNNVKVVKGETYTISAYVAGHRHNDCYLYVRGAASNDYELVAGVAFTPPSGGTDKNNWSLVYTTFVAQRDYCHIEFGMRNGGDVDPYLWFAKPMLNKGNMIAEFTESQNELHTGIMKVDHNGARCDFENGTRAEMGRNGFYYKTGDGQWEYHALSLVGEARIPSEGTRYIYLPEVFRGKNIRVVCQVGQIGNGTDAISNPKPLISFWAGADDVQNNPSGYAPYFRLYGSTRLRNDNGSVAYRDKEVLITYTVLA